jgi:hypothetical protein
MTVGLLQKEPATWHCQFNPPTEGWEEVELSPEVRRFAGVRTVEDYLSRLRLVLGHKDRAEPTFYSPFTLAASIDYLDAVWQLHFGDTLVSPPGVERSARLAFAATSAEEADSRFSALAELLKDLRVPGVPGVGGHALERLVPFLVSVLPPESHERIRGAVAQLDAARHIRAAAQHSGARSQSVDSYTRLGISHPVSDWPGTWKQVQAVIATAFDSIRDELQASDLDTKGEA